MLVMHFFNHQPNHRDQVHVMLTAAGAKYATPTFLNCHKPLCHKMADFLLS
tara:strand:+ start:226 stop:378 length:153 start_codon:yes stop_codon:yes gene_type:complete